LPDLHLAAWIGLCGISPTRGAAGYEQARIFRRDTAGRMVGPARVGRKAPDPVPGRIDFQPAVYEDLVPTGRSKA
jgi:hypothetical protein